MARDRKKTHMAGKTVNRVQARSQSSRGAGNSASAVKTQPTEESNLKKVIDKLQEEKPPVMHASSPAEAAPIASPAPAPAPAGRPARSEQSYASAQPRPRGPVTPEPLKGPVLFVGGGRYESQANAQVRQTIMDGLVGVFGEGEVTMVDIAGAANAVRELKPALVFSSGSYLPESTYFGEVSREARKIGAATAFWATEDPYEQDAHYQIDIDFDVIFSCDRWGHNFYGRKNVYHLPLGACPNLHYMEIQPEREKTIDVMFCGVAFSSRKEVARNLMPVLRQLNTRIIGPGWGELGIGFSDARIEKDQLVDLYSRSKMVLNLGRSLHFENKQFMIAPSTPGPRTFEAAAAGAFQVFHEDTYELRRYYDADEVPVFSNRFDFERLVDKYINDDAARLAASRKAQARTLNEHLYVHRIRQALEIMKREQLLP